MGWFDEQIEDRKKYDRELLSSAFQEMAGAVVGHKIGIALMEEGADIRDALSALIQYYHIKEREIPANLKTLEEQLDYIMAPYGIMKREIRLEKGWRKDAMGAMLSTLGEEETVIAILPNHRGGYCYHDPKTGKKTKITAREEEQISKDAYVFYKPFPMRSLTLKDFAAYMVDCLTTWDFVSFALAALIITLVGMLIPRLNHILMEDVITSGSYQLLYAVMAFMFCATAGSLLFTAIRELLLGRINTKMDVNVRAATMMRILSLPSDFFKKYSAGELNQYLTYMNSLCEALVNSLLSTGITGIFSLVYLTQIFHYASSLVVPSLCITFLTLGVSLVSALLEMSISKERMKLTARESGLLYSLITGIEKIRLSGSENRAFVKWAQIYTKEAELTYNPPTLLKLNSVILSAISLLSTIIMYYIAIATKISAADYYAFNASYAYISTAFTSLASVALTIATIRPILDIIHPLMDTAPEVEEDKETITRLSGGIEFSHVSFRYSENSPMIINDLSLTIKPRQYVAIVGKTGCGKSTLMRLLLGFEKPVRGAIYYDKKDMNRIDIKSLRKQIGIVLQDGKLFGGSLYDNISISAPGLSVEAAWEAAEIAGIADDIRQMPMGMHTMVQEGAGGISGGQRQRLMIARAIAPKPKVLMLDEATSALDNITQKKVSDALDAMKCTRIVIAHRLSTIRHCDRILVLDQGKIIEDGSYEELIALGGTFAQLVERQRLDTPAQS